jgi:hypothetical protein
MYASFIIISIPLQPELVIVRFVIKSRIVQVTSFQLSWHHVEKCNLKLTDTNVC